MLLFFRKMFLMRARARVCVCVCVCVVHWHCTAQLSMFNMEKRFRNKIIIIIIINSAVLFPYCLLCILCFLGNGLESLHSKSRTTPNKVVQLADWK